MLLVYSGPCLSIRRRGAFIMKEGKDVNDYGYRSGTICWYGWRRLFNRPDNWIRHQYQRILNVDWHKVQAISQNGIDWVANAITHVSSTIGASHPGTLSNMGITLVSSVSVGFALGLARG
jgi:hypothetical protein